MTAPSAAALDALTELLGSKRLLTDSDALTHYGRDWTRFVAPAPTAVALPETVDEVQAIVRLARHHGFALVPSGGRTGLSGGATAAQGEVVLSLERMNRILEVNRTDRSITVEAGVVTEVLQQAASDVGLHYPVDFASAGSSQIGGNIATNAGGIQVIRYGMTRDWVRGLKVVTGTGDVLELNRGLIKNNTGLDLRHLFAGSEGILGVIVEATLGLTTPPADPRVIVLGVPDLEAIMSVLEAFQSRLDLLAYEFFSELALQKVVEHQGLQRPFTTETPYYALLEFEYAGEATEMAIAEALEPLMESGSVVDAVLSQSVAQSQSLWRLREDISETISRWTPYKHDIATTISRVPGFLAAVDKVVADNYPDLEVVWFGHIGDGNLHLNILRPESLSIEAFEARCKQVSTAIFDVIASMGGSISAEHGVGLLKKEFLPYSRSSTEIALMRGIKAVFDPDNIMNPGKVFDPE
jgi:FAD/FMN-containing dehydrogenase